MRHSRQTAPQVNAGSMADIAFLLLIFFLVTASIPKDDIGIKRTLPPPCPENTDCTDGFKSKRNILEVKVNSQNELLVDNKLTEIEALKDIAISFLDNNGDGSCSYCNGLRDSKSSDNPTEAVISINNDKQTSYEFYIQVQDEITKAYFELRSQYAENILKVSSDKLTKNEIEKVKAAYPFILSEAEIRN